MSTAAVQRKTFSCTCGGPIQIEGKEHVSHACKHKRAPATSFYDGVERFVSWHRVMVNPNLTGGEERYHWFVEWRR